MDTHHLSLNRSTTSPHPASTLRRTHTPSQDTIGLNSGYRPNSNASRAELGSNLEAHLASGNGLPLGQMSPSSQIPYPDSSDFAYSQVDSKTLASNNQYGQTLLAPAPSRLHPDFVSYNPGSGNQLGFQMAANPGMPKPGHVDSYPASNYNAKETSLKPPMHSAFSSINSIPADPSHSQYIPQDGPYSPSQAPPVFATRASTPQRVTSRNSGSYLDTYSSQLQGYQANSPVQNVSGHVHPDMGPMATAARFHSLRQGNPAEFPSSDLSHGPQISGNTVAMDGDRQPRKKARPDTQQDAERHLLVLASEISQSSLTETASKIKRMETNSSELRNDPLLGQLCNAKDIRQDRHHQVFALAWLNQSCEVSPASVVPRNRIYARYVQMCGEYTLSPLMPSAFGRLVRISYPSLTTRRLGMRGKSKYHYCGVKLKGDRSQVGSPLSSYSSAAMDSPQSANFHTPSHTDSPGSNSVFATPVSFVNVQEHFLINDFKYIPGLYGMIDRSISEEHENNSLGLPSIHPYLPKDLEYDSDIADTLHALVKIQCTSIFESIRFLKKDDLFQALIPSPALLTGSVFKLLNNEYSVEWAKDCDLVMYRAMLKLLSRLHLKGSNKEIVTILHDITSGYVSALSAALGDRFSQNYKVTKLKHARQFIKLVSRLLRCIETGTRAAIVLSNPNDRNLMLSDWSKLNFHDTVLREIPCGVEISRAIINILEVQVVQLLQDVTQESASLARYAAFLFELPSLFSSVNPWLFSLLLSNLLTGFIREMSMVGSRSFKLWWIVGCWINEFMSWSFELGGYLHEEFYSSNEPAPRHSGLDLGLGLNLGAGSEYHASEKMFSTVDLMGDPHDQV